MEEYDVMCYQCVGSARIGSSSVMYPSRKSAMASRASSEFLSQPTFGWQCLPVAASADEAKIVMDVISNLMVR